MLNLENLSRPDLVEIAAALVEAKKRGIPTALVVNTANEDEYSHCAADTTHFINSHVYIDEPQGDATAVIPFHLWPAQADLLAQFAAQRLIIVLKARQLGITWLACAYVLWLCLFRPGRVALLFSKGQLEANELTRRIRVMYARLPDWMRSRAHLTKDNESELVWSNGSRVQSLAATRSAGRSFTASFVLMDEAAHMQWANEVYTALKPTIDAGGQLALVSTANGETGLFHQLWTNATQQLNAFTPHFLSWRARPGRDDAWRARVAAEAVSSALDLQEYPNDAGEAFQSTGAERFLPSMALWDVCRETLPPLDKRTPLVLAADAGVTNDCFALVGTSRHPARPRDAVMVRLVRLWKPKGVPLDFDVIEREIMEQIVPAFNVVQFSFDAYQLHQFAGHLAKRVWTREFSQQQERMIADKQLLDLIMQRRIAHDGNADLRAHIDNADRKPDADNSRLRIVKRAENLKVDLAVALSMSASENLRLTLA